MSSSARNVFLPTFQILPATPEQAQAIEALERACFPSPWRREFFDTEIAAESRYNRVVRDADGELIGYLFSMYYLDEMHVNKIAVRSPQRRQGIATALMKDCTDFARARGIRSISLEVRQSNRGAQDFYRHLSFRPLYTRPHYYPDGEAAVVMSVQLV
jgi:ribosomal-protein-alanine N-acetyltransferase